MTLECLLIVAESQAERIRRSGAIGGFPHALLEILLPAAEESPSTGSRRQPHNQNHYEKEQKGAREILRERAGSDNEHPYDGDHDRGDNFGGLLSLGAGHAPLRLIFTSTSVPPSVCERSPPAQRSTLETSGYWRHHRVHMCRSALIANGTHPAIGGTFVRSKAVDSRRGLRG